MNKYINYYNVLGIRNSSTAKEIKLAYYKISKESHPDLGGDEEDYKEITEAYKILSNKEKKEEYDSKSKFGCNYSEFNEIYDFEFRNDAKNYDKDKYEDFVKRDQLNILVYIDDSFDGNIEYERWVYCKTCNGSGTDKSAKINIGTANIVEYYFDSTKEAEEYISAENIKDFEMKHISSVEMILNLNKLKKADNIKDDEYMEKKIKYENGDDFVLLKIKNNSKSDFFDLSDECDFCDGTGKWGKIDCFYCTGTGKINGSKCLSCNGEKRMLGKQKLSGIKINKDDKDHKVEHMGNVSRDVPGKTGHLWIIRKKSE